MLSRNSGLAAWKTYEAMDETIRRDTTEVALTLRRSESSVRKWKECPWTAEDQDQSGRLNPLDMLEGVISTIEKIDPERAYVPILWLCARFAFLPPIKAEDITETDEELMQAMLAWIREIGESSTSVSQALKDGRVSPLEYKACFKEFNEHVKAGLVLLAKMKARIE